MKGSAAVPITSMEESDSRIQIKATKAYKSLSEVFDDFKKTYTELFKSKIEKGEVEVKLSKEEVSVGHKRKNIGSNHIY